MVIIAKKKNDKFIVELTKRELYLILGYDSEYSTGAPNSSKVDDIIAVEKGVQISAIYDKYILLKQLLSSKKIKEAVLKLELLADGLRPLEVIEEEIDKILNPKKKNAIPKDTK